MRYRARQVRRPLRGLRAKADKPLFDQLTSTLEQDYRSATGESIHSTDIVAAGAR